MNSELDKYSIGAFVLQVSGIGAFTVISFQLSKAIGAISACTISVSDCTQTIALNPSSYPKKLGSIKKLFQISQKTENIGNLFDVSLEQYTADGKTIWFSGKLCVITPMLDAAFGVKAGLQCYCMGKACMLMYQPSSDFIYVPMNTSKKVAQLQNDGVFKEGGLQQYMFATSFKPEIKDLLAQGINSSDTILEMLNKALKKLTEWRGKRGQSIGAQQQIDLADYFTCDVRLSKQVIGTLSKTAHPYVNSLAEDFFNGFNSGVLLQAIMASLQGRQRYLTFVPSSMESGEDMLQICPSYVEKADADFVLYPQDMLSCSVSANPQEHLRTPTCIYTRSAKLTAYGDESQDNRTILWNQLGSYTLPGAAAPYRLKLLQAPSWVLNTIVTQQSQTLTKGTNESKLLAEDMRKQLDKKSKQVQREYEKTQDILNRLAKTVFFHKYMMDKTAMITLAVSTKTLNIDILIGKSILFQMPIEASQLGKSGSRFYGRVQNVTYSFTAAQTPKAKSNLSISCSISGVTSTDSPGASLFEDDGSFFIYKRG